jgi:hypothetical protein
VGLLDNPRKRPAGKGHGSSPALYPANQRELLLTLLSKRPGNGIKSLARIPVSIWMYWGDEYVPLRQARRALKTWIGDPRVSMDRAKETAREILHQIDNPAATDAARRELVAVLADIAYRAQPDYDALEHAVRAVFEPGSRHVRRAVGHVTAPMMTDSVVGLIEARLTAVRLLLADKVSEEAFYQARYAHLMAYADYALRQPALAASTALGKNIYEPVTAEIAINTCCGHLLTTIGLENLYPERAGQLRSASPPQAVRLIPPDAARAILHLP